MHWLIDPKKCEHQSLIPSPLSTVSRAILFLLIELNTEWMCKDLGPQRKRNVTTDVKKQNNHGGTRLNTATTNKLKKPVFISQVRLLADF